MAHFFIIKKFLTTYVLINSQLHIAFLSQYRYFAFKRQFEVVKKAEASELWQKIYMPHEGEHL